ncbi:heparan-alpha-glucosaminide N-acetyltransferase-like [Choristoneura fumiferana]|uniref:heparan-alpha-glucosaminide N-acetyltransferase-like n=1 Tax=Choristoneura fumiferana TaxID=7141 RepID=UPI003D155341
MASWLGKPGVDVYEDIQVNVLPLNSAFVILNTTFDRLGIYSVRDDCYKCPFEREHAFDSHLDNDYFMVDTKEPYTWRILKSNIKEYLEPDYRGGLICDLKPPVRGYGVYRLDVGTCGMETVVQPPNPYWSLLLFSAILLSSVIVYGLIRLFLRRNNEAKYNEGLNLTAIRDNLDIMPSLHFLRGILLILIIFATSGGGGYPIFLRTFGGLTVAECFFFTYTFSIGLKIPVMFDEETKKTMTKRTVFSKIFVKSVFFCLLGMVISGTAPRSMHTNISLFAPLPRIAVAYLMAATVYMFAKIRDPKAKTIVSKAWSNVKTLFWSWVLAVFLVAFMIISIALFYSTKCLLSPESELQGNWTSVSESLQCKDDIFGEVFNKNLLSVNRDEVFHVDYYYVFTKGLMGFVSSILTALVGLKAGVIYVQETHSDRTKLWHLWAFLLCLAGITLAIMSRVLSFNLWPIAVVFVLSALSIDFYTLIYFITEVRKFSSSIISHCGFASIATLAGHLLFSHSFPFFWGESLDTHFFYLYQSSWIVLLWVIITVCWMKWRTFLINSVVSDEGTRRAILSW